jgi:hypothetical protein
MVADRAEGSHSRLAFIVNEPLVAQFFLLLQQGVLIWRRVGGSIDTFLREEIGAGPAMIEKIQSIVLDGKPVDDIVSALVHDGSVLALSAAMPGVVGATLRRGGAYASLRSGITYHETGKACMAGEGWVIIKIFNLLMAELGPGILRQGVLVKTTALTEMLAERVEELQQGCSVTLDGRSIDIGALGGDAALVGTDQVFLTVDRRPASA